MRAVASKVLCSGSRLLVDSCSRGQANAFNDDLHIFPPALEIRPEEAGGAQAPMSCAGE
jgi:hypothetical protein